MTNDQAVGYALSALRRVLEVHPIPKDQQNDLLEDFAAEIRYLFDAWTPEEAEERGEDVNIG